ncbi:MAG: hypothetical protein ACQES2_01355 [Pseudomonadota bacterium]
MKSGLSDAKNISESKNLENFGNIESLWELGNLRLRFIKERGQVFLDLGSRFDEGKFFIFDDVALLMKWQSLDQIIEAFEPLDLVSSLGFIKRDYEDLTDLMSKKKYTSTSASIEEISRKKAQAIFR